MKSQTELEHAVNELGRFIGELTNNECGFMLVLSSWGEHGWTAFVSNQERESTIGMLEELLTKLKMDAARQSRHN